MKIHKYQNSERQIQQSYAGGTGSSFDLKNGKTIVIKGADKGSAVVVWDRDDYIREAEKQLGDKEIYQE